MKAARELPRKARQAYNPGSNFDREGQWLIGKYLGQFWVTGTVVESRVKYGGKVQHTIVSDSPTIVNDESRAIGTRFTVEESEIFHVEAGIEQESAV